jgi:hypothetical protein
MDNNDAMPAAPPITTLPEFLEVTLQFPHTDAVVFRGHQSANWLLQPRLARMSIPDASVIGAEAELLDSFRRRCLPYLGPGTQNEWDLLAIAQHHGLATRLLDWTENALVALWFAVQKGPLSGDGAVFALVPVPDDFTDMQIEPLKVRRTMFFRPSHLNSRIVTQSAWLSVHYFNKSGHFSNLETVPRYRRRVQKVLVSEAAFENLRSELNRVGINDASLFPDLDGLSRHLNWRAVTTR